MSEPGGWLWAIMAVGVLVLGVALAYGLGAWRRRRTDSGVRQVQREVVQDHYRHNE